MTGVVAVAVVVGGVELFTNVFFRRLLPRGPVLRIPELRIERVGPGEKLVMASTLGNAASAEDEDLVAANDGGEAVGDQDRGSAGGGLVQRLHDAALRDGVERRRRLVENLKQNFRVKPLI